MDRKPIKPIADNDTLIRRAVEYAQLWLSGENRDPNFAFQLAWTLIDLADAFELYRREREGKEGEQ